MSVTVRPPQCLFCARFQSPVDGAPERSCTAFGDAGIPADVWTNRVDHRNEVDGDNGLMWTPDEGVAEFPEWILTEPGDAVSGERGLSRDDVADMLDQVRRYQRGTTD